ncbi:MAG: exosome complex protein Rrp42 [Candidatus Thermoplasmatota archaeon]|nr:exosome complex protein Rrp42 [Candidatus Thermoplasmatota archaeon]MDD5778754.1 exosome complex protein Rrp42 [Candidatus Thermoplasmatota archaeon]
MNISSIKKDYLYRLAKQGKRPDGRATSEYRPITIERGVVNMAEGSAMVSIGNTTVLAGIKMDLGEPYPDTPNKGALSTAAELIPLASPDFESGPPREDAIELARVVDRGIRESGTINLEDLCIEPGEKVWVVFIDIHILDYDGNLFDACSLAASAALLDAQIPNERFEMGENRPLPVQDPPISCTFVKYNGTIVVDPSLEEDEVAEARYTVAIDKNGDIRAMQKGLSGSFTVDEIRQSIATARQMAPTIRKILEG